MKIGTLDVKKINKKIIEELLEKYKCSEYRVINPNELITSDWIDSRLNIYINDKKEITDVSKG